MVTEEVRKENVFFHHEGKTNTTSELLSIVKVIKDCIRYSIDNDNYMFSITESYKKIRNGSVVVNLRICSRLEPSKCKYLTFVVDKDEKSNLMHVVILAQSTIVPSIIFTTTDQYPVTKLEKYIPCIISSTQNMVK